MNKLLLQALKKIPVFHALPPSQVRQLVSAGERRQLADGDILCRHDTPSDEMYILLSGELAVIPAEGMRVATIKPITSVGEMGVITGQPRVEPCGSSQLGDVEQLLLLDPQVTIVFVAAS